MSVERPPNAPDPGHPLLVASRYLDAEAEDHDLQVVVEKHGCEFDALTYVAEQRALRIRLMETGRMGEINRVTPVRVSLDDDDRKAITFYKAIYIDSLMIGWRACQLTEEENNV